MRDPSFDLVAAIARPGFTPSARDAGALVRILEGDSPSDATARDAARALASLGDAGRVAILPRLEQTIDDGAATRLIGALGALGRAGDPRATDALVAQVGAASARRRRAAIVALGKLGGDAARRGLGGDATSAARAAILARWDAGGHDAAERRALTEALGKLGGAEAARRLEALDATGDAELTRRRERALLMTRRDQLRVLAPDARPDADAGAARASAIDGDVAVPPTRMTWSCRRGLGPLLANELSGLGYAILERRPDAIVTSFAGPLRAAGAARLWTHLGLHAPLGEGALATAVPAAICAPAVRELLIAQTRGTVRWRLELASGGRRRALIWQIAREVARRAPELLNEPADTTWTLVVDEAARLLLLRPRRLEDRRFAWRRADVPAASHPTVAAAVAALAEPRGGERVWDPFAGSGSELIECARHAAARDLAPLALLGTDLDEAALAAAATNAAAAGVPMRLERADARAHRPGALELIATNPPLGARLRGDAGQLLCDALPGFAATLRRGGRLVWITPAPKRTSPVAEAAGLVLERAFDLDLGGLRARLERWSKPR